MSRHTNTLTRTFPTLAQAYREENALLMGKIIPNAFGISVRREGSTIFVISEGAEADELLLRGYTTQQETQTR